jgi:two-component system phosphate regulon response regulator PhoB
MPLAPDQLILNDKYRILRLLGEGAAARVWLAEEPRFGGRLVAIKELRRDERTRGLPVILLTAKGAESDKVAGLDAGADDYVVKPFSPRELVSRVRAVFRRRAPQHSGEPLSYGPLTIDPSRHEVLVDGKPVKMGLAEFKLLRHLVGHPERVFSRGQLLDGVWGDHVFIEERTVDVHVLRLRKALSAAGAQGLVQTVRGLGYRLSARAEQ